MKLPPMQGLTDLELEVVTNLVGVIGSSDDEEVRTMSGGTGRHARAAYRAYDKLVLEYHRRKQQKEMTG